MLSLSTEGTRGSRRRCHCGSSRSALRQFFLARCINERTKQTLARLRPGGAGGSARGYERSRVARHEHLNPWQAWRNSLRLDVGCSDNFGPFGNFRPDLESALTGRIGNRLEAEHCHALLDVRQHDNFDDLLIEQSDDLLGCPCWDEDSLPVLTLDVRVANFGHGGHAR